MRKVLIKYLPAPLFLVFLAMTLFACGGGDDGIVSGTKPPPTTSVVITGTVPGTVAIAYDLATGKEAARDVAGGTPKTFSLSVVPGEYYLMFIANEGTPDQRSFAFRNVTGGNVFAFKANTTLDLGVLVFNNYPGTAVPLVDPISGNDNVTESLRPEASFSPGAGEWIATKKFVNSSCLGHSPGTTITEDVTIAQGFGVVTYTPAGTTETVGGVANVNTAILTGYSGSALETIYLTRQTDGSLAGSFSKAGYGGGCSEDGTITAVLGTPAPPPSATLTSLSINGPSSMSEYGTAMYTATASWSDTSTSAVTPTWSVDSQVVEINTGGVLYCQGGVASDQTVTVSATYSAGGITKTGTMNVTVIHVPIIPFTEQELAGKVFFEEYVGAGGGYSSHLYILNGDFSLGVYATFALPRGYTSHYVTGTWSNDPYGVLDLNFILADQGPTTVRRITDSFTEMEVELYDKSWGQWGFPAWDANWEKTVPVDPSKLPGTYKQSVEGYTWVFNADGTGSVSILGGVNFTWSVDSAGVLRILFWENIRGPQVRQKSSFSYQGLFSSIFLSFAQMCLF